MSNNLQNEASPLLADGNQDTVDVSVESTQSVINQSGTTSYIRSIRIPHINYILLGMFCCLAFLQNSVFVEWNAIANSALAAFHPEWTAATLAWQINLATITSPFIQWPVWLAIQKYDLSKTIRWGAMFPLFISATITYIPLVSSSISNLTYKWLTYTAYVFTGITGVVFFSSITRFSRVWFLPEQRATSTGLLCTFANLGGLLPAIVGPIIVTDPNSKFAQEFNSENKDYKTEIAKYLVIYFVLASALLCAFLCYFPSDSRSEIFSASSSSFTEGDRIESIERSSSWGVVWNNFTQVMRRPSVIYIMLLQSLSTLPHIWGTTLLTVTLQPLGVSQKTIGILIIVTTLVEFITTIFVARLADLLFRFRLKVLILILLAIHTLAMISVAVAALRQGSGETNKYIVFVGYVIGIAFLNSAAPLVYELLAEISHPVPEDIINGLCNQCNNIFGALFYFVFSALSLQSPGTTNEQTYTWLLYTLMIVPSIVTILFTFVNESYARSEETSNLGISESHNNLDTVNRASD